MPDKLPEPPRRISPDEGHAEIQIPLLAAIDNLTAQVQRIDDAFLLLLSTVDFAQSTLSTVQAGQGAIANLMARVAALEAAPAPEPQPEPTPVPDPEPATDAAPEDLTEETP